MAITRSDLTSGSSTTDATSYGTASITPGADRLVLLAVTQQSATNPPATPTASGNGLTWVQIATIQYTSGTRNRRATLFRTMGASPSSGAVTIDFGGETQTSCAWSINEFDGVETGGTHGSGAVVQSSTGSGSGTSFSISLSAFSASINRPFACWGIDASQAITPESGYTELHEVQVSESSVSHSLETEWHATATDTSVTATTSPSRLWGGVAIEIASTPDAGLFAMSLPVSQPVQYDIQTIAY